MSDSVGISTHAGSGGERLDFQVPGHTKPHKVIFDRIILAFVWQMIGSQLKARAAIYDRLPGPYGADGSTLNARIDLYRKELREEDRSGTVLAIEDM